MKRNYQITKQNDQKVYKVIHLQMQLLKEVNRIIK